MFMDFLLLTSGFFTVYGERHRPDLAIHKFFSDILKGESITVYGAGDTSRDYTYVGDIVSGILSAIEYINQNKQVFEVINLGNNMPINILELVSKIEKLIGRKANIEYKQLPLGDVSQTYADISEAKALLNYQPATGIEEGLTRFYKWYIQKLSEL
jgi:UDP-glucuronate 4-epimerase